MIKKDLKGDHMDKRKSAPKIALVVNEYRFFQIFAIITFLSFCGCSSVSWQTHPNPENTEKNWAAQQEMTNQQVENIEREFPEWKNSTLGEGVLTDFYDAQGRKIGSAVSHK